MKRSKGEEEKREEGKAKVKKNENKDAEVRKRPVRILFVAINTDNL